MRNFDLPSKGEKPCFRCDGTGQTCNVCGESQRACVCDEMEAFDGLECDSCGGTGKANQPKPKPATRRGRK